MFQEKPERALRPTPKPSNLRAVERSTRGRMQPKAGCDIQARDSSCNYESILRTLLAYSKVALCKLLRKSAWLTYFVVKLCGFRAAELRAFLWLGLTLQWIPVTSCCRCSRTVKKSQGLYLAAWLCLKSPRVSGKAVNGKKLLKSLAHSHLPKGPGKKKDFKNQKAKEEAFLSATPFSC